MRVLISWIGFSDLKAVDSSQPDDVGPLCRLLRDQRFDRIYLLNDFDADKLGKYQSWLGHNLCSAQFPEIQPRHVEPVHNDYGIALRHSEQLVVELRKMLDEHTELNVLLSPGMAGMQFGIAVASRLWPDAVLWNTSKEQGVKRVDWPFHLTLDRAADDAGIWRPSTASHAALPQAFAQIVSQSAAMADAKYKAARVAKALYPVLLHGETGTGKELFAAAIHDESGRRGSFVPINCGALPETLLEAELFGHVKGSHSTATENKPGLIERADFGTLFLDEIGDMPWMLQVKLLRFLQDGMVRRVGGTVEEQVDVRIVAATHRDLPNLVKERKFREDLHWRLNTFIVAIPPLRQRGDDALVLAKEFLTNEKGSCAVQREFGVSAEAELRRHWWPGNVRELQTVVRRLAFLLPDDLAVIEAQHVRWALEAPASYQPQRALDAMTTGEFTTRLALDFDELIRRFNAGEPRDLPDLPSVETKDVLLTRFVKPLLYGRAYDAANENGSEAGRMLARSKLEATDDWKTDYRRLQPFLNTALLAERSGHGGA